MPDLDSCELSSAAGTQNENDANVARNAIRMCNVAECQFTNDISQQDDESNETAKPDVGLPSDLPKVEWRFGRTVIVTNIVLLVLNLAVVAANLDIVSAESGISSSAKILGSAAIMSVIGYAAYLIPISLVLYFASAALHQGFSLRLFLEITASCLIWLPLQPAISLLVKLCGVDVSSLGLVSVFLYAPMFALFVWFLRKRLLHSVDMKFSVRQATIISAIGTALLVISCAR